jgi:hypothetical protein
VRFFCTAVAICVISGAASAQSGLRSASLPNHTPTAPQPTQSVIRSPAMPDRSPTNPFVPEPTDVFLAPPNTYVPNPQPPGFPVTFPFGTAFYGPSPMYAAVPEAKGYLQLDVQPATAQVTIDGMFMGSANDFRRMIPGRSLEAGAHRVQLQAPGHEPLSFDVRIFPRETVTYRNELRAVESETAPAASPRPAAKPKTFYVIPGCYAGDKRPRQAMLPRGCDAGNVREVPPIIAAPPAER